MKKHEDEDELMSPQNPAQTGARSAGLDWLLESGNEPGPTGAKAVAQPSSRHAIISSVSPELAGHRP
jgi:hypothetical protein